MARHQLAHRNERKAHGSFCCCTRAGCRRDGVARRLPLADWVTAEASTFGQLFARQTHKYVRGMELRTGKSNQRHDEIVCSAAIAHNVNSVHQASSVSVPTACLAPWRAPSPHLAAAMPRAAIGVAAGAFEIAQ